MSVIKITGSTEKEIYNEYYTPFKCTADCEMPTISNGGYNNYSFPSGTTFEFENIPLHESKNRYSEESKFSGFAAEICVFFTCGKYISGTYENTLNKETGKLTENFFI